MLVSDDDRSTVGIPDSSMLRLEYKVHSGRYDERDSSDSLSYLTVEFSGERNPRKSAIILQEAYSHTVRTCPSRDCEEVLTQVVQNV